MDDRKYTSLWVLTTLLGGLLWLALIALKALGVAEIMGWAPLLLGVVWIPSLLLLALVAVALIMYAIGQTKRRRRKQAENDRIRAHAMAFGVWDRPEALGGKGLELSAWEHYKIKRKPGETDAQLRRRCMVAKVDAENSQENTKDSQNGGGRNGL